MPILSISLYLEPTAGVGWAPDGPGWYADVRIPSEKGGTEIIPRVRLSPEEADQLGRVIDNFVTGKELNWTEGAEKFPSTVHEAVQKANATAKELLKHEIERAEALAAHLESLRKRGAEFGVDDSEKA